MPVTALGVHFTLSSVRTAYLIVETEQQIPLIAVSNGTFASGAALTYGP